MNEYQYYGYRLTSEVPLPTLAPATAAAETQDIVLRLGPVPERLESITWKSEWIEVGSDGNVLAKMGSDFRFYISAGREIVLQMMKPVEPSEIETHLTSMVAGIVIHQRQALALHASAVAIGGAAVAFAGPSGMGKSTLASAFALQGCPLVSDDVCRIQFQDGSAPAVAPGPPRLRLWPDTAQMLGKTPDELSTGRADHPKRLLTAVARQTDPLPLGAVIRLALNPRATQPVLERVTGPQSVMPIDDLVYRTRLGRQLGRQAGMFQQLTQLGGATRVFRLVRPEGPPDLPRLLDLVQTAMSGA